jgi:HNH endonuclease
VSRLPTPIWTRSSQDFKDARVLIVAMSRIEIQKRCRDRRRGGPPQSYMKHGQTPYQCYGTRRAHVVIAERVLGRPLPQGAEVHHVDGNKKNNAPSNLVICQDRKYHALLHMRKRVLDAGGDPDTQRICSGCRTVKPMTAFPVRQGRVDGIANQCRVCKCRIELQRRDRLKLSKMRNFA